MHSSRRFRWIICSAYAAGSPGRGGIEGDRAHEQSTVLPPGGGRFGGAAWPGIGALTKPAYVATTVNLRAAPGTASEIVAKIPGGSLIDAGDYTGGCCAVT